MNRLIGLLGMMALLVDVVGCKDEDNTLADEDNPLTAEQARFVGCWVPARDGEEFWFILNADGTAKWNIDYSSDNLLQSLKWRIIHPGELEVLESFETAVVLGYFPLGDLILAVIKMDSSTAHRLKLRKSRKFYYGQVEASCLLYSVNNVALVFEKVVMTFCAGGLKYDRGIWR